MADDVRRLVLARWKGNAARFIDPDDLVQEVCRRILRRNRHARSAWDPSRGSLSHYEHQLAGNAIADMLKPAKRIASAEVHGDPEREDEHEAPEQDADLAPFDPDALPSDPDEREEVFRKLCVLEVTGKLPVTEQLWQRALRQRQAEQAQEREREARRREKLAALDAEIAKYIAAETAAGRRVLMGELMAMLGESRGVVRGSLAQLMESGVVESRGRGPGHGYWARTEPAPLAAVEAEPAPEVPAPEPAEEPAPVVQAPPVPAPALWPHRRVARCSRTTMCSTVVSGSRRT